MHRLTLKIIVLEQSEHTLRDKWGEAAKDGLMLALISVVIFTISAFVKNGFLGTLLWALKLVGSILLLRAIMHRYGAAHKGESTYSYGLMTGCCSAVVCAVFTFFLYRFIVPGAVTDIFNQLYETLNAMSAGISDIGMSQDMLLRLEDNYPQYACISMFMTCIFWALVLPAFLRGGSGAASVFTEEELNGSHGEQEPEENKENEEE